MKGNNQHQNHTVKKKSDVTVFLSQLLRCIHWEKNNNKREEPMTMKGGNKAQNVQQASLSSCINCLYMTMRYTNHIKHQPKIFNYWQQTLSK